MEPVSSNIQSKSCPDPIGSNCVTVQGPCGPTTLTNMLIDLTTRITDVQGDVDITGIDLSCLYTPTIASYQCPCMSSGKPAAYWPGGPLYAASYGTAGYCYDVDDGPGAGPTGQVIGGVIVPCLPVPVYTANPVPAPTTLKGIIQLMIDKFCQCDPCNPRSSSPNFTTP